MSIDRDTLTADIAQALAEHRSIPGHVRYIAKDCTADAETVVAIVWPVIQQAREERDDAAEWAEHWHGEYESLLGGKGRVVATEQVNRALAFYDRARVKLPEATELAALIIDDMYDDYRPRYSEAGELVGSNIADSLAERALLRDGSSEAEAEVKRLRDDFRAERDTLRRQHEALAKKTRELADQLAELERLRGGGSIEEASHD